MPLSKSSSYFLSGFFICLFGAICFSTKAIFVKLAYRNTTVDAITLLAWRMIFSLPFFLISAFASSAKSGNTRFTPVQWIKVMLVGLLGYYISSLLDFLGLQHVTAGIERLILFVYPTMVLLISALVFKEKISSAQWLAVVITYAGLFIAFIGEVDFSDEQHDDFYLGAIFIFACAITYALYIVGSGRLIPVVGAAKFNSYAMTFACGGVLVHYSFNHSQSLLGLTPDVYGYGLLMAILSTVVPSYLVTEGIKRIGHDNAAIVGSVGPVSTILQAYFFLNEPISVLQIAGTVLILFGVFLIGKGN